jgi:hypothetical protein
MRRITLTLLSDGPTDKALIPILRWLLGQSEEQPLLECHWADLRRLRPQPKKLSNRILKATDLFPCDILFIHRDAENQPHELRYREIEEAIILARQAGFDLPHICVVPVRMQEAWLLFNIRAIREAVGNPHGSSQIDLPRLSILEDIPNPKQLLYELLLKASELRGRHLRRLNPAKYASQVTDHIEDFSPLRELPAFRRLESDIQRAEY